MGVDPSFMGVRCIVRGASAPLSVAIRRSKRLNNPFILWIHKISMVTFLAGLGMGLSQLALAGPTGFAFGYGYGNGVRHGYNSYKPSKNKVTNQLHLSANPITGSKGAGLLSAEEMMDKRLGNAPLPSPVTKMGLQSPVPEPKQVSQIQKPVEQGDFRTNKIGLRRDVSKMSFEEYRAFMNAEGRYGHKSYRGAQGQTSYIRNTRRY